jgi:DNA repair exonuclease SbcCD ATPase subunit
MNHELRCLAINEQTGRPALAQYCKRNIKGVGREVYICIGCGEILILKKSPENKIKDHFAHKPSDDRTCIYRDKNIAELSRDEKLKYDERKHQLSIVALKSMLEKRYKIQPVRRCSALNGCKNNVSEITDLEPDKSDTEYVAGYQYMFNEKKIIIDLARIDGGELKYIFEIYDTHRTDEGNRPDKIEWFEFNADEVIDKDNELESKNFIVGDNALAINIRCRREIFKCDDCELAERKEIEERRIAEELRIAKEEHERLKKIAENNRRVEENNRRVEENNRRVEENKQREKKAEEERIEEIKRTAQREAERLQNERIKQIKAEERRIAQEKKAEEERVEEIKRRAQREEERLQNERIEKIRAEERRIAQEKLREKRAEEERVEEIKRRAQREEERLQNEIIEKIRAEERLIAQEKLREKRAEEARLEQIEENKRRARREKEEADRIFIEEHTCYRCDIRNDNEHHIKYEKSITKTIQIFACKKCSVLYEYWRIDCGMNEKAFEK